MANLDLLEKSIPVAPIKIAALKGCEELGKTVNDYLVQFRKELMEHRTNGIAWSGYAEESLLTVTALVSVPVKQKVSSTNLSVEWIFSFFAISPTTVSLIK